MLIKLFNVFVKITAWLPQKIVFKIKVFYEDKSTQGRNIKGPAIIVSNHTSIFDYAVYLFVFWSRTLRFVMAEVLFEKQPLGLLLKMLGGIRVNRNDHDFAFVTRCEDVLNKGGVVGIFPEARLPREGEKRPLPFKPSAAFIALSSGAPIIPVYTDGNIWNSKRNGVIIGKPIIPQQLPGLCGDSKADIEFLTHLLEDKIVYLGAMLNEKKSV